MLAILLLLTEQIQKQLRKLVFVLVQIRELSGKLLTIPHGEIRTIQNFNKGWMRVIERITVSYQEDPTRVKELLEEVCVILQ